MTQELDIIFRRAAADRLIRLVGVVATICALDLFEWVRDGERALHASGQVVAGGELPWLPTLQLVMAIALLEVGRVRPKVRPRARVKASTAQASSS